MKLALHPGLIRELRPMVSWAGCGGLAALLMVSGTICLRRMLAPAASISPWLLLGCGLLVVAMAVVLRELAALEPAVRRPAAIVATAAMFFALVALSLPPTALAVIVVLWIVAAVEESAYWWKTSRSFAERPRAQPPTTGTKPAARLALDEESGEAEDVEGEALLPSDCLQQLTRSRTETGGEAIYALLRAEFSPGERQRWLHVAFCPPLAVRPQCSAHFAEGASGVLEVEEVEAYGARLMVRLPQAALEPESLLVEMFAETKL